MVYYKLYLPTYLDKIKYPSELSLDNSLNIQTIWQAGRERARERKRERDRERDRNRERHRQRQRNVGRGDEEEMGAQNEIWGGEILREDLCNGCGGTNERGEQDMGCLIRRVTLHGEMSERCGGMNERGEQDMGRVKACDTPWVNERKMWQNE